MLRNRAQLLTFALLPARSRAVSLLALSVVCLLILSTNLPAAQAAAITCEDIFSSSARSPDESESANAAEIDTLDLAQPAQAERKLLEALWSGIKSQRFSVQRFQTAKEFYRIHLNDTKSIYPKSSEERLALFELLSDQNSIGLEGLSTQISKLDARTQSRFAAQFSKRRFDKGIRVEEAHTLFTKMYLLTHVEPRAWREVLSRPLSQTFETIIRQRAEMEFGRSEFVTALFNLGLIRAPDMRGRLQKWAADNSAVLELSRVIGVNAATYSMLGLFTKTPSSQALLAKPVFKPETLERLRATQWKESAPFFLREAKQYAHADLALTIGMKVTSSILMGIAIGYFAPMMVQATLPPGYTRQDEGFFAMANDSVRYWYNFADSFIRGDNSGTPANSTSDLQNRQDLTNLLNDLDSNLDSK